MYVCMHVHVCMHVCMHVCALLLLMQLRAFRLPTVHFYYFVFYSVYNLHLTFFVLCLVDVIYVCVDLLIPALYVSRKQARGQLDGAVARGDAHE